MSLQATVAIIARSRVMRFFLSGGLNTVITYCLYVILLQFMSYQVSYSISYITGIIISYFLNKIFVFRTHRGVRSALLFPLVYVAQYGFGIFLLWLWIDQASLNKAIGPLVVIVLSMPLTYLLTRLVFVRR